MFKAVITEETTTMQGTIEERLAGFCCYIKALQDMGISEKTIKDATNMTLEDNKKENSKVETIFSDENIRVQKIDLNDLSKEEAKEILDKEVLRKLFD